MICAIHQPNFFPWLGYFNKIERADVFVFLDNVDYPKSSKTMSTWSNRVAVLLNGAKQWINCPVIREEGKQKICTVKINNSYDWRTKLIRTLEYNYKKSRHYHEVSEFIYDLIGYHTEYLADYNCYIIEEIVKKIRLGGGNIVRQSKMSTCGASTELLIEITQMVGCDSYMCGGGAAGYQQDERFQEEKIKLLYQGFTPKEYDQGIAECVKGLSVLDTLFHCGFEETKYMITGGNK